MGRDGAAGGTAGVAVAGRGVVVPDDEAEEVLLGPGEDCTLVGLRGKVVLQCNALSFLCLSGNFLKNFFPNVLGISPLSLFSNILVISSLTDFIFLSEVFPGY